MIRGRSIKGRAVVCLFSAFLFVAQSLCFLNPLQAAPSDSREREYVIKAALIGNFIKFIKWPKEKSAEDTLIIGVYGKDPFGKKLDKLDQQKSGDTPRKILFKRFESPEDFTYSHILFIAGSEKKNLEEIVSELGAAPILLISDIPGAATKGVGINFISHQGKIWFECNPANMTKRGLKVSSYLLSLGKVVEEN